MLSQITREARFRIQAPNSSARDILVVPLDDAADAIVAPVIQESWRKARFAPCMPGGEAWRAALAESKPDLIVVIGKVGAEFGQVIAIGETCLVHHIKVSGVLIRRGGLPISSALRSLRPWTQTLAVVSDADYLPELLHALGA